MNTLLRTLTVAILVAAAPATFAQTAFERAVSPEMTEGTLFANYELTTYFTEDVAEQRDGLHLMRHDFAFTAPVWQPEDASQELLLGGDFTIFDIDTGARLPRADSFLRSPALPGELYDVGITTTYRTKLGNDAVTGVSFRFGSASDRPFASSDEITLLLNAFYRLPAGDTSAWLFLLNWSNNREFAPYVPIPGVAYEWKPDERLSLFAGLPYTSVRWAPIEQLSLEGTYFIPRTIHAQINYLPIKPLKIYAAFDWESWRFFRADRPDDDDRLQYYEKRVAAGVRWSFDATAYVDFSGGYAFDRFFFEGEGYDDRGDHRVNVSDGPFLMLQFGLRL